ncbi:MAG: hypothetical protein KatS3mg062_1201 [Tepidiforma sp.]|nr:MAG: hypothetical protein KatS3mg062_1201 [Tepidiforma sp.]
MRRFGQGLAFVRIIPGHRYALLFPLLGALLLLSCRDSSGARQTVPLPASYRQMLDEVAEVRGLTPPGSLRIGTVRREELGELLASRALPTETSSPRDDIYRLLGLLPPGTSYEAAWRAALESSAGAVYIPGQREVWLIRDGVLPESPESLAPWERRLLAHEFVHALQDYHFDISRLERIAETLDARLALRALLEGDAVWSESQWTARHLLPSLTGTAELEPPPAGSSVPPALARESAFAYGAGSEWVALLRDGNASAIDEVLRAEGPWFTSLVLHPQLVQTGWSHTEPAFPREAPGGWSIITADSPGEFVLSNWLQSGIPALRASQAAAGWLGDRAVLYQTAADRRALAVRIEFRDAKEAGEFAAAHRELLASKSPAVDQEPGLVLAVRRDGVAEIQLEPQSTTVTIVAADDLGDARELAAFLRNR